MGTATRETLLSTRPPEPEQVPWLNGEHVFVAAWSSRDRDSFEMENLLLSEAANTEKYGHLVNIRARLLVRCIVDENRTRILKDEDAMALGECWCVPVDRAFAVAKKLCAFSDKDLEELEKNSAGAPSDSSGTT